jgi:predicted MFS family arabinose efflux permease
VTRPGLDAIREGLRFTRERRAILGSFVIDLDAMIFGMPTSLFPVLALDVFQTGPAGFGLLAAAPAAGAFLGALFSGWVSSVRRTGRAILAAVGVWGLAITAFGLVTVSFPLALLCLAVAGAADVFSAVFRSTLVQTETPDTLRGRVMSIHILVVTSGPRLGDIEAAVVAALTSPQFAVVSGGLACLIGVGVVARRFPELADHVIRRPATPSR